ncbi:MAG: hypothetical protein LBC68_12840 [Prevotellaceae bacterium]|jgi:hypothetical protein|nr:hypothetical protein [Prevotellaceae bacterium]
MGNIKQPDPVRVLLKYKGTEYICKYMPVGWRDQSGSWSFSFEKFGYNYKHETKELQFVKEDADFIRQCVDEGGISANIEFTVQLRQNNWTYKDNFHGKLDFATQFINEMNFVQCGVLEAGMKKAITKDGKTNYDMPFDNDAVDIEVTEGMQLKENVRYSAENTSELFVSSGPGYWIVGTFTINLNLDDANSNILTSALRFGSQSGFLGGQAAQTTLVPFLTTTQANQEFDITIPLKLDIKIKSKHLNSNTNLYLSIYDVTTEPPQRHYDLKIFKFSDLDIIDGFFVGEFNVTASVIFTIGNNIKKYAIMFGALNGIAVDNSYLPKDVVFDVEGNISFDFWGIVNSGTFNFKAYRAETFGQKLLDKIYQGATFEVPFLQQMEQNDMQLFITSADAIRGIKPTDEQPQGALIKTNFNEFLKNLDCLYSTAQKANNTESKFDIVKKPDIFDANNEILNLGKVKNLQAIMPETDWFKNNVQVGYEKQEYNYPLGRQDFANTLEFNNDIDLAQQKMELISKYRADYTGVHLLHFDYVNSDKKDSKSDNDVFWILAFKKQVQVSHDVIYTRTLPLSQSVSSIYISAGQSVQRGQELMHVKINNSSPLIEFPVYAEWSGVITSLNVSVGSSVSNGTLLCVIRETTQWQAISGESELNFQINGLEGGGYFNIMLSPKQMLINHARFFASILDKHAKILRYTSSTETMSDLSITTLYYPPTEIVEKADLSVANAVPFFKPIIFEFDALVGRDLAEILGDTPCGYFTFEYNNLVLKGFPIAIEGGIENSEQGVKCIAHPDTPDNIQEILHKRLPNKLYK